MKILITGVCGFVGSNLAAELRRNYRDAEVVGLDNLCRPGSEQNRAVLRQLGVRVLHADIRCPSDLVTLPPADWVIDAAANPSVLAGLQGQTSSRQLIEHNLIGTFNILEYCKCVRAGIIVLSTSRVYSLPRLSALKVETINGAMVPLPNDVPVAGLSEHGVAENFSTEAPLSLYGASKLASEVLASEYAAAFGFPVHINRCGVLAGAGQFGKADQGIFSFWIHSWRARRPLKYIGFGGTGHQVRDCLHPRDLTSLLWLQMNSTVSGRVLNVAGGVASSRSLAQLSAWCAARLGPHSVGADPRERPFDLPWLVLDSRAAEAHWGWRPQTSWQNVLEEIAQHAEANPDWLDRCTET